MLRTILSIPGRLVPGRGARRRARELAEGEEFSAPVAAMIGAGVATGPRRLAVPPRAAAAGRLPGPGVMSVADVPLPSGSTTRPVDAPPRELDDAAGGERPPAQLYQGPVMSRVAPALWVSSSPLAHAGGAWRTFAAGFATSGLWPLLLPEDAHAGPEPWYHQRSRRERDQLGATAGELFRDRLERSLADSPLTSTELIRASAVSRGELRRASGRRTDALEHALTPLGSSRLGLVGVRRPADALHRTAWPGAVAAGITGIELAELVASWEERYGALLVGLLPSSLVFAVLRPPSTLEEAVELVAEQHAMMPREVASWGDDRSRADALVDAPVWQLGWA